VRKARIEFAPERFDRARPVVLFHLPGALAYDGDRGSERPERALHWSATHGSRNRGRRHRAPAHIAIVTRGRCAPRSRRRSGAKGQRLPVRPKGLPLERLERFAPVVRPLRKV
jgi:hypothetical protein